MKKYKSLISTLIINIYLFSNISIACCCDFSISNSTLSPQLVLNVIDVQNLFLKPQLDNAVILIKASTVEEIPEKYKQELTPAFFVEVLIDWVKCQDKLIGVGPAFFAFGSARFKPGHYWYGQAKIFGRLVADQYISMITGGGPGIMQGANQGAFGINGVSSVGLCMELPHEKDVDHFVYKDVVNIFTMFFTRKLMFILKSNGGVTFPGGFGTLDEVFEIMAFNQRYPHMAIPNILIDDKFYSGLMEFLYKAHFEGLMPLPEQLLLEIRNTTEEAFEHLRLNASKKETTEELNLKVFIHELFSASRLLTRIGPAVSVVGGIDTQQDSLYWLMARNLSVSLSDLNINVMRRGNRGIAGAIGQAYNILDNTHSVDRGLFIALHEDGKRLNANSTDVSLNFEHYFSLKIALMEYSKFGMVFFPGGIDTLDVLFEMLCLIKTDKISSVPIVLVGRDFWQPLLDWIKQTMVPAGTINAEYLDLIYVVDSEIEAQQIILEYIAQIKKTEENLEFDRNDDSAGWGKNSKKLLITLESIMSKAMVNDNVFYSNKFYCDFIQQAI